MQKSRGRNECSILKIRDQIYWHSRVCVREEWTCKKPSSPGLYPLWIQMHSHYWNCTGSCLSFSSIIQAAKGLSRVLTGQPASYSHPTASVSLLLSCCGWFPYHPFPERWGNKSHHHLTGYIGKRGRSRVISNLPTVLAAGSVTVSHITHWANPSLACSCHKGKDLISSSTLCVQNFQQLSIPGQGVLKGITGLKWGKWSC